MRSTIRYGGLDVHKDTVTVAVCEKGTCAPQNFGTVRTGWFRSGSAVITLDVLAATEQELRQGILAKLRAVLWILVVVLKMSGFSMANCHRWRAFSRLTRVDERCHER
jgi:hypothetical protein